MVYMKCKNCGGEMSVDSKGELYCPYCGTKSHFSDVDFQEYKNFRLNLLNYLRASADASANQEDGTFLWNYHDQVSYFADDGTEISIQYLFYANEDNVKTYVAKNSVIYVFAPKDTAKVQRMLSGINMLSYPSADIKGLAKYFPEVKSNIRLKDGGTLVAFSKPENVYPLFAFGNIRAEHVAWIVSRLENHCCVFEYSGITQGGLSLNSVFINPRTHEAYLYGGWWNTYRKRTTIDNKDLCAIREVAKKLVGEYIKEAPRQFAQFLSGRPCEDAYSDFGMWDRVIEEGFGGHKFINFSNN